MQFQVTISPTAEPITLEEAKMHLRVDGEDEDLYITALIQMAREVCENYCNRAILTQTVTLKMQNFPDCKIPLRFGNIQSITSIKYFDREDQEQTIDAADYVLHSLYESYIIAPAFEKSFPLTRGDIGNITVTYVAGWTAATKVPAAIRHAMLLTIGEMYENREDAKRMATTASMRLLNPYKLWHL